MRRSSRVSKAPPILSFRASQGPIRTQSTYQHVLPELQTEQEQDAPHVCDPADNDINLTPQAPEHIQTSSRAPPEYPIDRTVHVQIPLEDRTDQMDTASPMVESVNDDNTVAPEVTMPPGRPSKRICHELPDRVPVTMYIMGVGRASNKVSETMSFYVDWPCQYPEIRALLAEHVAERSEKLPGAWDAIKYVSLQGLTSKKTPAGCHGQFFKEEHWQGISEEYETLVKSTGKLQRIAFRYKYKAKAATPPSSQARLSQNTSVLQRHGRPQFSSPSPSASLDSEDDGILTPPPTLTPQPRIRETTTTRRESELNSEQWKKSQIEQEIRKIHKCGTCNQGYCYRPIHGRRHCQIHKKSLVEWVNAVYNDIETATRLPATCPEYKAWLAEIDSASSKAHPGNTTVEPSHGAPSVTYNNYYGQAPGVKVDEAKSHAVPCTADLLSSPPTTSFGEATEEYELLADWLNYTVDKHKELSTVNCFTIRGMLQDENLGFHYVRDKLRENSITAWKELKAFGITLGVARCLHLEENSWKNHLKGRYDGFRE